MKCITLTQPWATLVAIGAKQVETRSWSTSYRGPLAIHAGKGLGPVGGIKGLHDLYYSSPFYDVLFPRYGALSEWDMPLGAIIAVTELIDCREIVENQVQRENWMRPAMLPPDEPERSFGNHATGRFGWLLSHVRALPEPIPAKGALGLWNYEGAV